METGNYSNTGWKFLRAIPNTTFDALFTENETECGIPPADSLSMWRPPDDPFYPWPGVMFGLTISGVWYWCTDQVHLKYIALLDTDRTPKKRSKTVFTDF